MYRAFYALPEEIATTTGEPTNALLGFANMLVKLLADYRPQGVLVCWDEKPDAPARDHPEYKASRRPMPDLLREQQPHFKPLVEAFGYQNFSVRSAGGRRRDRHPLAASPTRPASRPAWSRPTATPSSSCRTTSA